MSRNTVKSNAAAIAAMSTQLASVLELLTRGAAPAPVAPVAAVLSVPTSLTDDIPSLAAPVAVVPAAIAIPAAPAAVAPRAGRDCCPSCSTPVRNLVKGNVVMRTVVGGCNAGDFLPPYSATGFLKSLPLLRVNATGAVLMQHGVAGHGLNPGARYTHELTGEAVVRVLKSRQDNGRGGRARAVSVPGWLSGKSAHPSIELADGPLARAETDDELAARVFSS